jgi:hypothetical protein
MHDLNMSIRFRLAASSARGVLREGGRVYRMGEQTLNDASALAPVEGLKGIP